MELVELISAAEACELQARVDALDPDQKTIVRINCQSVELAVVCVCHQRRVLTWYASPYKSGFDADAVEAVITAGIGVVQLALFQAMEARGQPPQVDSSVRH